MHGAGVRIATVRIRHTRLDQARIRLPLHKGQLQCRAHRTGVHVRGHRPTHPLARKEVQHHRQYRRQRHRQYRQPLRLLRLSNGGFRSPPPCRTLMPFSRYPRCPAVAGSRPQAGGCAAARWPPLDGHSSRRCVEKLRHASTTQPLNPASQLPRPAKGKGRTEARNRWPA